MASVYFDLLQQWCDAMIRLQPHDLGPEFDGGLLCPACKYQHGRCGDAVYPFMYMADRTGDRKYVEAAKAGGAFDVRILLRHILPNCIGPIIVQTTMNMAIIILQAASLSFLGLGINPPTPEWGAIISSARSYLRTAPHIMLFPGIFLVLSSLSISLLGDGLRDALDPRLKS